MAWLLIPRWASPTTANDYKSTQVYQSCYCEPGYCNSDPPQYRHFIKVQPENLLYNHILEYKCLLCYNYIKNLNGQLTPAGCFSLSPTLRLFSLYSREPAWMEPLNERRDKEMCAPTRFYHKGIVQVHPWWHLNDLPPQPHPWIFLKIPPTTFLNLLSKAVRSYVLTSTGIFRFLSNCPNYFSFNVTKTKPCPTVNEEELGE